MSKVAILHPNEAARALQRFLEKAAAGEIQELAIVAPNAKDGADTFFCVTGGMKLSDLLMARHILEVVADRVSSVAVE